MKQTTKSGFTIIEVTLVLAIAGLIFMMVFLALPALQRSQRDTQRSNDISRLQSAITQFQANNKNRLPGETTTIPWDEASNGNDFITKYVKVDGDTFTDPDGEDYDILAIENQAPDDVPNYTFEEQNHQIRIYTYARCDGEQVMRSTGARKIAIWYKKEGGGAICLNN